MKKYFKSLAFLLAMISVLGMVSCNTGNSEQTTTEVTQTETQEETTVAVETTETTEKASESIVETVTETETEIKTETKTETETETEMKTETKTETETELQEIVDEIGLDITNRSNLISICYSVWFDGILGTGDKPVTDWNNITEVLEGKRDWGGVTAFHYWAKPAQGYYRSTDKKAARNNLTLLGEADVDFIILDYTNNGDGYLKTDKLAEQWIWGPLRTLCEVSLEMRAEGMKVPYIVPWFTHSDGPVLDQVYEKFYCHEEWKECFVYWDGKPFILSKDTPEEFPRHELFTMRRMWGLTKDKCWRFLNVDNSKTVYINNGPEQISVATATQETYMSLPTAHGRDGGKFFYNQWLTAFRYHPKVVTITWWNEWAAQRLERNGEYVFTDNYNAEYSRDIEPMEGGHGDLYYQWMKQYIAAYKAGDECPKLYHD